MLQHYRNLLIITTCLVLAGLSIVEANWQALIALVAICACQVVFHKHFDSWAARTSGRFYDRYEMKYQPNRLVPIRIKRRAQSGRPSKVAQTKEQPKEMASVR